MAIFGRRRKDRDEAAPKPAEAEAAAAAEPIEDEAEDDDEPLYRAVHVQRVPLGDAAELVTALETGVSHELPRDVSALLPHCQTFETLADHAAQLAQAMRMPAREVPVLATVLGELAGKELLVTHDDVVEELEAHARDEAPAPPIAALGVVTRDRPEALARAAGSYLANAQEHGHEIELFVADDSDAAGCAANRDVLRKLGEQHGLPVAHAGEAEKRRFAEALVGPDRVLDPALVEFALLDPHGAGYHCGANRNAFLLHAQGDLVLSADDDTCARLARPPTWARDLVLNTDSDPTAFWWFRDREAALAAAAFEPADVLGEHGLALGASAGRCASGLGDDAAVDLDRVDPVLLARLRAGRARTVLSAVGFVGDCGMGAPGHYLMQTGTTRDRLVGDPDEYAALRTTREVIRAAPRLTLAQGGFLMTAQVGFDLRTLLPPFCPVFRNSDGVLAATLARVCPGALIAHLPWGALHEPPEARAFAEDDLLTWRTRPRFADLLIGLVQAEPRPGLAQADPARRLRVLGRRIEETGSLATADFTAHARAHLRAQQAHDLEIFESHLRYHGAAPEHWAGDVERIAANLHEALVRDAGPLPRELADGRDPAEAWETARRVVRDFGALLAAWPDLVERARELRAAGTRLAQPVSA